MEIQLRAAHEVPQLFIERLGARATGELASITTFSVQEDNNPMLETFVAEAGPDDVLAIDYFGYLHGASLGMPEDAQERLQADFPGEFIVLNRPDPGAESFISGSFFKRSHVKAYSVGQKILSLGGVNCMPYSFDHTVDLMTDFESADFMDWLHKLWDHDGDLRDTGRGEEFMIDEASKVLVDYGQPGHSLILNSLCRDLKKEVDEVVFSSTYIPHGRVDHLLAHHLKAGKIVRAYANEPAKFQPPNQPLAERALQAYNARTARTPWIDRRPDAFNHLKAAVITYGGDKKVAYLGSHNFHGLAVAAGHAEVCLRTTDPRVIQDLENFIATNLDPVEAAPIA